MSADTQGVICKYQFAFTQKPHLSSYVNGESKEAILCRMRRIIDIDSGLLELGLEALAVF
jgi:hypothetical protein